MYNRTGPVAFFAENGPVQNLIWSALQFKRNLSMMRLQLQHLMNHLQIWPDEILHIEIIQPLEEIGRQSVRTSINRLKGSTDITHMMLETRNTCHRQYLRIR